MLLQLIFVLSLSALSLGIVGPQSQRESLQDIVKAFEQSLTTLGEKFDNLGEYVETFSKPGSSFASAGPASDVLLAMIFIKDGFEALVGAVDSATDGNVILEPDAADSVKQGLNIVLREATAALQSLPTIIKQATDMGSRYLGAAGDNLKASCPDSVVDKAHRAQFEVQLGCRGCTSTFWSSLTQLFDEAAVIFPPTLTTRVSGGKKDSTTTSPIPSTTSAPHDLVKALPIALDNIAQKFYILTGVIETSISDNLGGHDSQTIVSGLLDVQSAFYVLAVIIVEGDESGQTLNNGQAINNLNSLYEVQSKGCAALRQILGIREGIEDPRAVEEIHDLLVAIGHEFSKELRQVLEKQLCSAGSTDEFWNVLDAEFDVAIQVFT